jgi:hypothetical protein
MYLMVCNETLLKKLYKYWYTLYPPATEETGAMGHEIESRQGIVWWPIKDNIIMRTSDE